MRELQKCISSFFQRVLFHFHGPLCIFEKLILLLLILNKNLYTDIKKKTHDILILLYETYLKWKIKLNRFDMKRLIRNVENHCLKAKIIVCFVYNVEFWLRNSICLLCNKCVYAICVCGFR